MANLSWEGLAEWNKKAEGFETIGVGIRPYGLHAGNLASVIAYPYLMFEDFERRRRQSPQFTFQIWLNDIEPMVYVGEDGLRESADDANMYPGSTTFQFTPAPHGYPGSMTDYWHTAVEHVARHTIGVSFPDVTLEFRRASELVCMPEFERMIVGCIKKSDAVKDHIDTWNASTGFEKSRTKVRGWPSFVWPLSPTHREPLMHAELDPFETDPPLITVPYRNIPGDNIFRQPVGALAWAVQFRMLHAARLAAIQPHLWLMGMDHRPTNMGYLMENLAHIFKLEAYCGDFLHVPLLFAGNERKLSKRLGDAIYTPFNELLDILRRNPNSGIDMTHAPMSSDIMSIGPDLLPSHMTNDRANRMARLKREMDIYEASGERPNFRYVNSPGRITKHRVAHMVGTPHL